MKRRIISMLISFVLCMLFVPSVAMASENKTSTCYIFTTECPAEYIDYAAENASNFILSLNDNKIFGFNSVSLGTPFAFLDNDADVYYFPVICDGSIRYLFRVYADEDSFSAAITEFLANEINNLANYTSIDNPMSLKRVDTMIIASIGSEDYVLFEYPAYMSFDEYSIETASTDDCVVVDAKSSIDIELNLHQTRDVYHYLPLDISETQSDENWCSAFCLAAIIRTKTSYDSVTARDIAKVALGSDPDESETFPWNSIGTAAKKYGLNPTVLRRTVTNATLIDELNAGRPCIVAMESGSVYHAIVLRGYSSLGTWGIWNPWFDFFELYSISGSYVPTGYSSRVYSFTPYMHAYNFGK